ncbi:MAG: hypothetical protein K2W95_00345 [Candidatus Obscuribacterales bacterium]|nr:hypothetical protein [Candidatus Obscuribacterales bacterium]
MSRFQIESLFAEKAEQSEAIPSFSPFLNELADIQASSLREKISTDNTVKKSPAPAEAKAPPRTAAELVKDATEKFDKATDKNQAMKDLRDEFNQAIKKSDEELEAVKKRVLPALNGLANEMADALEKVNPAVTAVFDAVDKVPAAARREIQQKIARYLHMDPSHQDYAKLRADFAKYPGLTAVADVAAREVKAAQPIFRKYNPPAEEYQQAGNQSYIARSALAKCLEQVGNKAESEALMKAASDVLGRNPDPAVETLRAREHFKKALKQLETSFPKR